MFSDVTFAKPGNFYLFIGLIPLIAYYVYRLKTGNATLQVSTLKNVAKTPRSLRVYLRHLLFVLRLIGLSMLIVILARPQYTNTWKNVSTKGIDIVLSVDVSSSMLAEDFKPNRLEASKDVATSFITGRPNDKMGLVVFAGESFTQCPLTIDHAVLINLMSKIKSGVIEDGTAIGQGLATAINRLKDTKSPSKVIILLTDGVNNQGAIDPLTAAEIAKNYGIRVYTIGVGSMGMARYPAKDMFGRKTYVQSKVEIDEALLKRISDMTNGKYYRATNKQKLLNIYKEIDLLEKAIINEKEISSKEEKYFWFIVIALSALFLETTLKHTLLRTTP